MTDEHQNPRPSGAWTGHPQEDGRDLVNLVKWLLNTIDAISLSE